MKKEPSERWEYDSAKKLCDKLKRLMVLQSRLRSLNSPGGKKLVEIAKELGISKKTAYRDLTTLQIIDQEFGGKLTIEARKA